MQDHDSPFIARMRQRLADDRPRAKAAALNDHRPRWQAKIADYATMDNPDTIPVDKISKEQ